MFGSALIFGLFLAFLHQSNSNQEEIVETWATKFGEELWEMGTLVTRIPDIKSKYKGLNARVLPTNGEAILNSIVTNLNRMMKQKMDAVMCIVKAAENLSENFEFNASSVLSYHGSKVSIVKLEGNITEEPKEEYIVPKYIDNQVFSEAEYREMELSKNTHFYGIPVNTSYSAVHVPTDVFDQGDIVKEHIQWSEELDEVFVKNYMSDPTLKWQYFGSSTGFLRHYPAFKWKEPANKAVDEFDCRTRPWFIEAATCSKDVVILMDTSGSMTGMRLTMARLTVKAILDTFSNNDFINVLGFSNVTRNVVPCFTSDMLVQATHENIKTFKEALDEVILDGKSNFSNAYIQAFNLLEQYRETKSCPEKTCNQAIMLVTDSVTDNLTEVFQEYNWFENKTHIPVRVFTYLIGREVTKVREIQWMACLNRGYYVHVQTLEEARSQVLKYIPVIARPLVLQGEEHPISWTHPFADISDDLGEITDFQEYRMMTAVSAPAFDIKKNKNNETKSADLLGIAGTDVYIRDIERLTLPYKIGANGYAFVITNNGYLLLHPDSRPVYRGKLKDNYNSVDLSEVELLDDDVSEPRQPSPEILQLRQRMLDHKIGTTLNLKMKFHYDDFRRVGAETRNYYYAPLDNTPFTIGLVLPHSYGNYWIKAGDEIRKTVQMGGSVTDFFKGNWRVHPNWVYCDYHRSSAHWNESREERLLEFMKQMKQMHWNWYEQYPDPKEGEEEEDACNRRPIGDNEYYCDKELMQLLVFDAKSTQMSYETKKYVAKSRRELELVTNYKVMLRFLATQSGLTRWQYISDQPDEKTEWGDSNNEALSEPWYRSAVLQHHIDPDAFVFSVPFDAGELENITVTASHAIFPKDGGNEAPGSVVGILFPHETLLSKFLNVTSKPNCPECDFLCSSDNIDCYVIDGNAYILVSEIKEHTGHFFGEVEGAIMDAMVSKNIFRRIRMFDYQGLCFDEIPVNNTASFLLTPVHHVMRLGQWLIGNLLWFLLETTIWRPVFADDEDYFDMTVDTEEPTPPTTKKFFPRKKVARNITVSEACDKQGDLYLLQHLSKEGYHSTDIVNCSRPYTVKRIPHTNLLLIVVDALHQSCYSARSASASMEKIIYQNNAGKYQSCQKLNLNVLPRRRLSGCFNEHPLEHEIITCGRGSGFSFSWIFLVLIVIKAVWSNLQCYIVK